MSDNATILVFMFAGIAVLGAYGFLVCLWLIFSGLLNMARRAKQ